MPLLIILVIVLLSFLKFSVNIFFSWELNGSSLKFSPVELYSLLRKLFRCMLSSGHLNMKCSRFSTSLLQRGQNHSSLDKLSYLPFSKKRQLLPVRNLMKNFQCSTFFIFSRESCNSYLLYQNIVWYNLQF